MQHLGDLSTLPGRLPFFPGRSGRCSKYDLPGSNEKVNYRHLAVSTLLLVDCIFGLHVKTLLQQWIPLEEQFDHHDPEFQILEKKNTLTVESAKYNCMHFFSRVQYMCRIHKCIPKSGKKWISASQV